MDKETQGREPIEIIEIDQDFCQLIYGESGCLAVLDVDQNKCFNTLGTCGAPDNYLAGTKTLRFCNDQKYIPQDNFYFPFLEKVKVKPSVINPADSNRSVSALGKRATISASFSDHPSTDFYLDNYQTERLSGAAQANGVGYDPLTRSTFWRKWKARNLYWLYRPMRYISGYIENGVIVDSITQHFVITNISGPDNRGNVTIQGADILTLAQKAKAQAPKASEGKLLAAIDSSTTAATLTPSGIGNVSYPSSGYVRIGEEVCSFTRSGDSLTLVRAQYNTTAADHDEGDTIQLCLEFAARLPYQILYTLLSDYAGIADTYLDIDQWIEESVTNNYLPQAYSTLITEPESVEKLVSEMIEQMYFYIWFDTRTSKVKMRAVRPIGADDVVNLNYSENIIGDSIKVNEKPDQIISRVVINYALFNPAKDLEEASNYRVTDVFVDLDLESENKNRSSNTKIIYSRWLPNTAGAAAIDLGEKLIARYAVPPQEFTFSLDAKDRDLWTGDFANITSPFNVNSVGEVEPINVQVLEAEESSAGSIFSYKAQRFRFEEQPADNEKLLIISSDEQDLDLREWYDSQFPLTPPQSGDVITFQIRENVVISSSSTSIPALDVGTWPAGVTLNLTIGLGAVIAGKGGTGGNGGVYAHVNGYDGGTGGAGLLSAYAISITNLGIIGGGGGGGGGGGAANLSPSYPNECLQAGGGGGGGGLGLGGNFSSDISLYPRYSHYPSSPYGIILSNVAANGSQGTQLFGNGGGAGEFWTSAPIKPYQPATKGGEGGLGGDLGQNGSAGETYKEKILSNPLAYPAGSPPYLNNLQQIGLGGAGGAAGAAVDGDSNITWVTLGDIRGNRIN